MTTPKWHYESDSPVDSMAHKEWELQKGIDDIFNRLPPWTRKAFRLYMKIASAIAAIKLRTARADEEER